MSADGSMSSDIRSIVELTKEGFRRMDERFHAMDKRFDDMIGQMNARFTMMLAFVSVGFTIIIVLMTLYRFFV